MNPMNEQRPIERNDRQAGPVVVEESSLRYMLQKQNLLLVAFLIIAILTVTGAGVAVIYAVVEHFSLTFADSFDEPSLTTVSRRREARIAMQKAPDGGMAKVVFCFIKPRPMATSPHVFRLDNDTASYCDAIVYTSLGIHDTGTRIRSRNHGVDVSAKGFQRLVALKKASGRPITIWICVGGGEREDEQFKTMVSSRATRLSFINSVIRWMKEHTFDGVVVYWRYPSADAKSNFSTFINTLQFLCNKVNLRMTLVIPWNLATRRRGYLARSVYAQMDYVIVDSHKTVDPRSFPVTTCQSPTRSTFRARRHGQVGLAEILDDLSLETDHLKRTVLSVSLGGISFTVKSPKKHRMGTAAKGAGSPLGFTNNRLGVVSYYDVKETLLTNASWTEYYHTSARCAVAYNEDQWIGFENRESIQGKRPLVRRISGMAVWDLEMDDFAGGLGPAWPLLAEVHDVVHSQAPYDLVTLKLSAS
ncbi:endochitinase-like [Ornithodoros turicata]|uniref:endochitinase-like n=1 Tax=Ornithodoros turicata TaxID=34597 RepID=UPI00313A4072